MRSVMQSILAVLVSGVATWPAEAQLNPCHVDSVLTSSGLGSGFGRAHGMVVRDNIAYLATDMGQLVIFDLTDPLSPKHLGTLGGLDTNQYITVDGNTAWLAATYTNTPRISAVDISDPANPTLISRSLRAAWRSDVQADNSLLVISNGFDVTLDIYDVSEPEAPVLLIKYPLPNAVYRPRGIQLENGIAYVNTQRDGIHVIDLTDPTTPTPLSVIRPGKYSPRSVVKDNRLYTLSEGLVVYDVTNAADPVLMTQTKSPVGGTTLHVDGNYAFVPSYLPGDITELNEPAVGMIDISDPTHTKLLGYYVPNRHTTNLWRSGNHLIGVGSGSYGMSFDLYTIDLTRRPGIFPRLTEINTPDFAYEIARSGDHLAVADSEGGVLIYSLSNPDKPSLVDSVEPAQYLLGVDTQGSLLAATDTGSGLRLFDLAPDGSLTEYGSPAFAEHPYRVRLRDDLAFVADVFEGLLVFDISDRAAPQRIATLPINGYPHEIRLHHNRAYISTFNAGLAIVSIDNPAQPSLLGRVTAQGTINDAVVVTIENRVIVAVADDTAGLRIIDATTPANPVQLAQTLTPGPALGVTLSDALVLVADEFGPITAFDISNPESPIQRWQIDAEGESQRIFVYGDRGYVAQGEKGLITLNLNDQCCLSIANTNRDTVLDIADIQEFISQFLVQSPGADFNKDGYVDLGDIVTFLVLYDRGC